ncbi:hypothetical protein GHK92_19855 [Nocardioides sp. dk4132]|uniref:hyaluronate lyase N-terminal domain-containing protein n=1 Tax=unclassified Nocardioides TaxID=2615069 RepID=UPI001297C2AE|nr:MULTISPECIES: hypothetical protein [unclassified Nocardioides]MQW78127.1 hypothetical protein [Nocardioides sp. dk4132]QGA09051.1 hypothetical protein GFH29_17850 [Nocardioides sp. dk884]
MATIKFRRGTAAQWAAADPVLAAGEPGFETDTDKHKIGDGSSRWAALPYYLSEPALHASTEQAADGRIEARGALVGAPADVHLASCFIAGTPAATVAIMVAPFRLQVLGASVVQMNGPMSITQSADNFWQINLLRVRSNSSVSIAGRSTRNDSSVNGSWDKRADFDFDFQPFANNVLEKGDIVAAQFAKTGAIGDPVDVTATVRYLPL